DPRKRYMATFSTYYDTSGNSGQDAIVTVGLISSIHQWALIERAWPALLKRHKIPYVHMREIERGEAGFAHLKAPGAKDKLYKDIFRVVHTKICGVLPSVMLMKDYDQANKDYELTEAIGRPTALCIAVSVRWSDQWPSKHRNGSDQNLHLHESGDGGLLEAIGLLRQCGVTLNHREKKDKSGQWFVPFQLNDFVSWMIRNRLIALAGGRSLPRPSLDPMIEKGTKGWLWHKATYPQLAITCRAAQIPRRS
ncbi:MAG: hypothetical protein ABI647_09590, partial [Gemmatimonadota bacterium]